MKTKAQSIARRAARNLKHVARQAARADANEVQVIRARMRNGDTPHQIEKACGIPVEVVRAVVAAGAK